MSRIPPGLDEALRFPLFEAILGRRARRVALGGEIPDGTFAFKSRHPPKPLSELERLVVLTAMGGNTGWNFLIMRAARYAPHLSNYSAAAGGRTFPSAAGLHTSQLFFTDDSGTYFFDTRDAPALPESLPARPDDLGALLEAHRKRIRKLGDARMVTPREEPYMDAHNTWSANVPGSLLVMPMADLAQHLLGIFCFLLQNGACMSDDVTRTPIAGLEQYRDLADLEHPFPLSYLEQYALTEATAELATSCYAGALALQAMGLGGWMYDGIDRHTLFGAVDLPGVGLGFRFEQDPRWSVPNATGLPGVFEAFCPPNFRDLRAAVDAFCERKFGRGGPFHPETPGPWKDTRRVRSSAQPHDERFRACVALQAQHVFDRFGKFPGTVPSIFALTMLQAQHLDREFYDRFFEPGAYLRTHAEHDRQWHAEER